jgi:prepilin-type N-terminal cleavage/methylation domain-containing protein
MYYSKERGFTLVEIAIVLVVIGLLLGGILKGQQLINSARVRNLADQNSGVQAAYYGFIDRFRNVPGDMKASSACTAVGKNIDPTKCAADPSTATIGGDGNGRIEDIVEAGAVWSHLSVAGFLTGTYTGNTPDVASYASGVADGRVPGNAFQGPILLAHTDDYMEGDDAASIIRLAYSFGGNIPVPILRDLDTKLDDGVAGSGVLRTTIEVADSNGEKDFEGSAADPLTVWVTSGTATDDCVTSGDPAQWNVDSPNQTCNALFLY